MISRSHEELQLKSANPNVGPSGTALNKNSKHHRQGEPRRQMPGVIRGISTWKSALTQATIANTHICTTHTHTHTHTHTQRVHIYIIYTIHIQTVHTLCMRTIYTSHTLQHFLSCPESSSRAQREGNILGHEPSKMLQKENRQASRYLFLL